MLVKTISYSEPRIGDEVKAESIFNEPLYICHIQDGLIYVSYDRKAAKGECDTFFPEDITVIR